MIKVSVSHLPRKFEDITATSAVSGRLTKKEEDQEIKPVSQIAPSSINQMVGQWRVQSKLESKVTDQKRKLESLTKKCERLQNAVIYSKEKEAQTSEKIEKLTNEHEATVQKMRRKQYHLTKQNNKLK